MKQQFQEGRKKATAGKKPGTKGMSSSSVEGTQPRGALGRHKVRGYNDEEKK